jgi:translation initiation factor IF-3
MGYIVSCNPINQQEDLQLIIKQLRINNQIRAAEVRVVGEKGEQLGVMPVAQALDLAKKANVDLVEVAPTAVPPVVRMQDYGKFKYEQTKKEHSARKGQKNSLLKEMRLRPRIKHHDLGSKIKLIRSFLEDGDKVKVSLVFRGREASHPDRGWTILKKIVEDLKDVGSLIGSPATEGANINVTFLPLQHQVKPKEAEPAKEGKDTANAKA